MGESTRFKDVSLLFTKYVIKSWEAFDGSIVSSARPKADLSTQISRDLEKAGFGTDRARARYVADLQPKIRLPDGMVAEGLVLVSVVPDVRVISVSLGFKIPESSVDDLIFLQQAIKGAREETHGQVIRVEGVDS